MKNKFQGWNNYSELYYTFYIFKIKIFVIPKFYENGIINIPKYYKRLERLNKNTGFPVLLKNNANYNYLKMKYKSYR